MSNATSAAAAAAAADLSNDYADDATWVLTSSFVILTMQSGFGLLEMGSSAPGFEVNIMMKNVVDGTFYSAHHIFYSFDALSFTSSPLCNLQINMHSDVRCLCLLARWIWSVVRPTLQSILRHG